VELKDILAGKTPEEQTEWLKSHMPNWDEFIQGSCSAASSLPSIARRATPATHPGGSQSKSIGRLRGLPAKANTDSV
jgi:hypothetical protein